MFRSLDFQATSFGNDAGVLVKPTFLEHEEKKLVNHPHIATILPLKIRGNHRYPHEKQVRILT